MAQIKVLVKITADKAEIMTHDTTTINIYLSIGIKTIQIPLSTLIMQHLFCKLSQK